jgi:hypothetical protein
MLNTDQHANGMKQRSYVQLRMWDMARACVQCSLPARIRHTYVHACDLHNTLLRD